MSPPNNSPTPLYLNPILTMFIKRYIFTAVITLLATANAAHVDIEKRQSKF